MAYRISTTKRVGGKIKRYKNLAVFNKECSKRSTRSMTSCEVTNYRFTRKAGCLATVKTVYYGPRYHPGAKLPRGAGQSGAWTLHFNDCGIMRRHLQGRVEDKTKDSWLSGARKRRRR